MKKIKLDLDQLKVESFDTTPLADEAVEGYCTQHYESCGGTCPINSCGGTCDTCPPTDCSCPIRSCIGSSGGFPCP